MAFDTEAFIREIQNRPALWDKSVDDYTNTDMKRWLWEELVDLFGGKDMDPVEKKELSISLQKKWKNVRDCFTRELRRTKSSGAASKRKSQYTYFDQLLFLKPSLVINEFEEIGKVEVATAPSPEEPTPEDPKSSQAYAKRKKVEDCLDKELIEVLSKGLKKREEMENLQADEDRMFLLSLLPDLKQVSEDIKLRTKIELMKVIEDAKRSSNYAGERKPCFEEPPDQDTWVEESKLT